jgi:hypothetical protein
MPTANTNFKCVLESRNGLRIGITNQLNKKAIILNRTNSDSKPPVNPVRSDARADGRAVA